MLEMPLDFLPEFSPDLVSFNNDRASEAVNNKKRNGVRGHRACSNHIGRGDVEKKRRRTY